MGFADRFLHNMGGIATTAELNARGVDDVFIEMSVWRREIVRVRQGWYACPEVPATVIRAIRVGGRLACASALQHYGLRGSADGFLHIAVPRRASRLKFGPPGSETARERVVVHWSRQEPTGNRYAVSVEQAWAQLARCKGLRPLT